MYLGPEDEIRLTSSSRIWHISGPEQEEEYLQQLLERRARERYIQKERNELQKQLKVRPNALLTKVANTVAKRTIPQRVNLTTRYANRNTTASVYDGGWSTIYLRIP